MLAFIFLNKMAPHTQRIINCFGHFERLEDKCFLGFTPTQPFNMLNNVGACLSSSAAISFHEKDLTASMEDSLRREPLKN